LQIVAAERFFHLRQVVTHPEGPALVHGEKLIGGETAAVDGAFEMRDEHSFLP
jgi:hypothetical protein